MSLIGDMNRAKVLCDPYLGRTLGQATDTKETGGKGMGNMMVGLVGQSSSSGGAGMELLRNAKRSSPQADINSWLRSGELEAKDKTGPIRCQASAALIAFLLSGTTGIKTTFDIVSQGPPTGHGHWFVVANNKRVKLIYPDRFPAETYVVDIWGAIRSKSNKKPLKSSVVYPARCLYNCGEDNTLRVVAEGNGGYQKSNCCFLTTAACASLGRENDCEELRILRQFRDEVLERSESGQKDLDEYYTIAPSIVDAIERHPARNEIYREIFAGTIRPAVQAILRGDYTRAYSTYANCVAKLKSLPRELS